MTVPLPGQERLLEARGLTAGYGPVTIVRDLDLEIDAGEVVALVGPNGAGKTTTLLTLAGQIPALGGQVLFRGAPTTAPLFRRARLGLGLITEQRPVLMSLTVRQNFQISRSDMDYGLTLFPELESHLERRVGLLSGGQQRMVALARILGRRPSLLLADELSLGLAPILVDRLLSAVRAAADGGIGVLLVEQNIHKALNVSDRVVVLRRGRIRLAADSKVLDKNIDAIRAAYFASDDTPTEQEEEAT